MRDKYKGKTITWIGCIDYGNNNFYEVGYIKHTPPNIQNPYPGIEMELVFSSHDGDDEYGNTEELMECVPQHHVVSVINQISGLLSGMGIKE